MRQKRRGECSEGCCSEWNGAIKPIRQLGWETAGSACPVLLNSGKMDIDLYVCSNETFFLERGQVFQVTSASFLSRLVFVSVIAWRLWHKAQRRGGAARRARTACWETSYALGTSGGFWRRSFYRWMRCSCHSRVASAFFWMWLRLLSQFPRLYCFLNCPPCF